MIYCSRNKSQSDSNTVQGEKPFQAWCTKPSTTRMKHHMVSKAICVSLKVSTRRMISSFSSDDQLKLISFGWMSVDIHTCSAFCIQHEINWNREKINKLNGERWCNYIHTIHHRLTRLTSSWLGMNGWLKLISFDEVQLGWSSFCPHYIQPRPIIQAEQADHPRINALLGFAQACRCWFSN